MKVWMSFENFEKIIDYTDDRNTKTGKARVTVLMDELEAVKFIGLLGSEKEPSKVSVTEIKSASSKKKSKASDAEKKDEK